MQVTNGTCVKRMHIQALRQLRQLSLSCTKTMIKVTNSQETVLSPTGQHSLAVYIAVEDRRMYTRQ
jgi:hypothetical protein